MKWGFPIPAAAVESRSWLPGRQARGSGILPAAGAVASELTAVTRRAFVPKLVVQTSGSNRVDEKVISDYTGEPISRADAEFVRATTGFAIGGVPPIGHLQPMETYLDEDLLQYRNIWAAGGTPNAVFELTPADLLKMTGSKAVRIKA